MFSGLFITLSLCHLWGHILELFSFTFQKILEGKDKCHPASLEGMMCENSKHRPGLLCLCAVGSVERGNASTRLISELSPFISCCPGDPFEKAQVNSCASKQPKRC